MRQLVYVSSATVNGGPIDVDAILAASRKNNARNAVTGLLYSDGRRFLQVLEGEDKAVKVTFDRIALDQRHRAIVIISDRGISEREFGDWAMAHRAPGDGADAFQQKISRLVSNASPNVRATFEGFAQVRRA